MALYAFDGTWNNEKDAGRYDLNTNVIRFKDLYQGEKFFFKGVGTRHGALGKFFGGAFGVGGHDRIENAKKKVKEQFAKGDRVIDIVGFSRGAALAVHFANEIAADFRKLAWEVPEQVLFAGAPIVPHNPAAPIRFLGVWDIVASFGIPIDLGFNFNRINLGYQLALPEEVQFCYHAIALDERRQSFRPTRMRGGCEVWFRGVHSDVGGGNENRALNDITLRWMLNKAMASGLEMADDCIATQCSRANIDGAIADNFDPIKNRAREPKPGDRYHYTVAQRARHVNPPDPCDRETELLEGQFWKGA